MSIVRRNNNKAIIAAGATQLAYYVGQRVLSPTGQALIWDGVKFILEKIWNRRKKKKMVTDLVAHPGTFPGAIAAPTAVTRIIRASKPKFQRSKGAVTVTHREYLGDFDSASALIINRGITGNVFRVNPSNSHIFPWLGTLASNFDQYKFNSLSLQYVPLCSTLQTGRIAMYFDKDSQDQEPTDRAELANMAHLTETAPWAEARLNIPVDNVKRFMNDNTTSDPKLVDLGQIGVASYGSSASSTAGEIFVHYTVTFYEPQPTASLVSSDQFGGVGLSGPRYFRIVRTGTTQVDVLFDNPGTYLVVMAVRLSTLVDIVALGSATRLSDATAVAAASHTVSSGVVRVNSPGDGLSYIGTGFTSYTVHAIRTNARTNTALI